VIISLNNNESVKIPKFLTFVLRPSAKSDDL